MGFKGGVVEGLMGGAGREKRREREIGELGKKVRIKYCM
jgi:hypothetical protein